MLIIEQRSMNRREEYRESLRQDILDAARQLFVQKGFEATSMRAVADKVGCSPGILYHYFEDKAAIMARLVRETFIEMRGRLNAINDDAGAPAEDRLRRSLRGYIDFGLQHPHHYALLFMKPDSWEGRESIQQAFSEEGHKTFACLLAIVEESIRAGILRPELKDHVEVAQALWAAIHGMVSVQIGAKGFPFIERTRLIERHIDLLMSGALA